MAPDRGAGSGSAGSTEADIRRAVARVARRPREAGVFLDFDGVLAEIRPRPDEVSVPEATRDLLLGLTGSYAVVAVVSGRPGDYLAALLSVPGLVIVGSHGAELRWRGVWERWEPPEPGLIEELACTLGDDPELRERGVTLERKPFSLALHARTAPDAEAALAAARRAAEALIHRSGLEVLWGRQVVELRPPGIDKGSAVADVVGRAGLRAAAYVGDDRTDLDAFGALDRLRTAGGLVALTVAVDSPEAPPELLAAADLVVAFGQVPTVLEALGGPGARASGPRLY